MPKIKKIFSRIHRNLIFLWDGINYTKYMHKYNKWLRKQGIDLGAEGAKYIHHTVSLDGHDYSKIHIGSRSVISVDTIVLIHDFAIEVGLNAVKKQVVGQESFYIKDVYIGDNCFIGAKCVILCGTSIGDNCIVGAGSVLPGKQYPNNCVIAGNPAKVICSIEEWVDKKIKSNDFLTGGFKI